MSTLAESELDKFAAFDLFGHKPHTLQEDVHRSTAQMRVLACGTRWGKTTTAWAEGLPAALEPSPLRYVRRGWVVAPSYELAEKVFREMSLVARISIPHLVLPNSALPDSHASPMRLLIRNLGGGISEIKGKSADNPDSLLGEALDWMIVDEAARLKPSIWNSYLSARLMDRRGWSLLISTPKGKGWFFDMWRRGQAGDHKEDGCESWNAPSWSNPHLDRGELERRRARTPGPVWDQEYGAQFIEGAGSVFRNVQECASVEEWSDPEPSRAYFAGLDLAQTLDFTVLTILDDERRVVFVERFNRIDWSTQGVRLKVALERYGNPPVLVDSTGAGAPVYEALLGIGLNAFPYPFTNASKKSLIDNLALAFERKELSIPTIRRMPEMVDEVESFEYSITDGGTVRMNAPSGQHDDCVISLALAVWQHSHQSVFVDEPLEEWE